MPAIRSIVSKLQGFVDKLNGMDEGTKRTVVTIALLVASIGPLLIIIGTTISKIGVAMQGFVKLANGVSKLKVAIQGGTGVLGKLGAALGGVSAPVLAVVAVIAVLVLEYFLSVHNKAVEEKKRFKLGNITVTDNNDYISYSNSEYSCTLDAIKSKLINTHGGYLMVRYTDSGKILDYLAEFNVHSIQTVEYGKNLMDVKITRDHTERITALIPLGAKKKTTDEEGNEVESDERIDITSVNGGQNYIYDDAAVKEIGWIWTTEVWENVTLPGNLLRKANARLAELIAGITSMELTIVDESDTGADIGSIHARQFVDCLSLPHGIDGRYACMSKTVDYLNPSGNTITIGASGIKLTTISAKQNENLTAIEDELLGQTATIEGISGKVDGIAASKMYRTELIVDGVSIFKDKDQNSRLSCKVYSWDKDITATLPDTAFVWHRKSGNEESDAQWDSTHTGMKSIIVTTEDVQDNASFYCEVSV